MPCSTEPGVDGNAAISKNCPRVALFFQTTLLTIREVRQFTTAAQAAYKQAIQKMMPGAC